MLSLVLLVLRLCLPDSPTAQPSARPLHRLPVSQTVAAPYATELLDLQPGSTSQRSFLLEQLQQQAADLGQAAAAMPGRVQRIDATLGLLESGDLKLRVRVLEAERAARRAGVIQARVLRSL